MSRFFCWIFGHADMRDFRFPEWMVVAHCGCCGRMKRVR